MLLPLRLRPRPRGPRAALVVALLVGACGEPSLPGETPPPRALDLGPFLEARDEARADPELLEELSEAIELRQRRRLDVLLDAVEPGELFEHARLDQVTLDTGAYGLDALFVFGDELFELSLRTEDGFGNGLAGETPLAGDGAAPNVRTVHAGEFGGPDARACASCHSLGGLDGAGTPSQHAFFRSDGASTRSADEREAPHLLGLGAVEALGREMTEALDGIRRALRMRAAVEDAPQRMALETHGVRFGILTARPDGTLDVSEVEGVDPDLVVRPFGWKGTHATIRSIATEAFRVHQGATTRTEALLTERGVLDPEVFGTGGIADLDRDGVSVEVDDGMLTTMSAYLAMLEVPVIRPPTDPGELAVFAEGAALFAGIGCASCHRPSMPLRDPRLPLRPDHPDHAESATIVVDVARDGEAPKIEPDVVLSPTYEVALYSDLRRHAMGEALATPRAHGSVPADVFLTRSLWGLADTAPYLHDGRAATLDEAIRAHGGEAAEASAAYGALSEEEQRALRRFLSALTRTPRVQL